MGVSVSQSVTLSQSVKSAELTLRSKSFTPLRHSGVVCQLQIIIKGNTNQFDNRQSCYLEHGHGQWSSP